MEKLCFTQLSTIIYWNRSLTASDLFHLFSFVYTFYCHMLKSTDVWTRWVSPSSVVGSRRNFGRESKSELNLLEGVLLRKDCYFGDEYTEQFSKINQKNNWNLCECTVSLNKIAFEKVKSSFIWNILGLGI